MILTPNINLSRIVSGTWKSGLFSVLTCLIAFLLHEFLLKKLFTFPAFIPTVLGTALAFFIGFNNNQAYDRWWEARQVWGSLVNNSRTWTRLLLFNTASSNELNSDVWQEARGRMIKRHIAFLYALKGYLRKEELKEYTAYLQTGDAAKIAGQSNIHNAILTLQAEELEAMYKSNAIDGYKFLEINKTLTTFCDDMGKSERIRNTVFPTTYNYYSRFFIWIFIFSATMTLSDTVGIWGVAFGTLVGYVFFTIQALGQTLIDPFEDIASGIPLNQITRTIEINLLEMLGEMDIPKPVESVGGEYVM